MAEKIDLAEYDYQCVVDMLVKLGSQLNRPNYRFLKGDIIAMSLEKATNGRLEYVDAVGYDSIDQFTGKKYEIKSVSKAFSKDDRVSGKVNLCNTYKMSGTNFAKTFDYLICVQTDPSIFAIAEFSWETCDKNKYFMDGQFNLKRGTLVERWICKDRTEVKNLSEVKLNVKKLLETVL